MSTPSLTSPHVLKNNCERCAELEARLEHTQFAAESDLASLAGQLARMERENDRLRSDRADERATHTKQDGDAYAHWLKVMGKNAKTCKFGESRKRALARARRAGLTQDDVLKVITTHALFPFLVFGRWAASGGKHDRKDDLVDAFKEEKRWESLLELADAKPSPAPRSSRPDFIPQGYTRPLDNLVRALERNDLKPFLSGSGQGSALCPIHDDRQKSFRFREADNGSVLMFCQSCSGGFVTGEAFCEQVRRDLEIPLTDLYPNRRSE